MDKYTKLKELIFKNYKPIERITDDCSGYWDRDGDYSEDKELSIKEAEELYYIGQRHVLEELIAGIKALEEEDFN